MPSDRLEPDDGWELSGVLGAASIDADAKNTERFNTQTSRLGFVARGRSGVKTALPVLISALVAALAVSAFFQAISTPSGVPQSTGRDSSASLNSNPVIRVPDTLK